MFNSKKSKITGIAAAGFVLSVMQLTQAASAAELATCGVKWTKASLILNTPTGTQFSSIASAPLNLNLGHVVVGNNSSTNTAYLLWTGPRGFFLWNAKASYKGQLHDVSWDAKNNRFLAVGEDENSNLMLLYSTDGQTWTKESSLNISNTTGLGISASKQGIVIAGGIKAQIEQPFITYNDALYSPADWGAKPFKKDTVFNAVTYGYDAGADPNTDFPRYVSVGISHTTGMIRTIDEGEGSPVVGAATINLKAKMALTGVAYADNVSSGTGIYVATGQAKNAAATFVSTDNGATWDAITASTGRGILSDVLWTGSNFVAVGWEYGKKSMPILIVQVSADGKNWLKQTTQLVASYSAYDNYFQAISYMAPYLIAATKNGSIFYSLCQ